jgi:Ca2+-binding RTX toxin-like protein
MDGGAGNDTYNIAGLDANGDTINDTAGTDIINVTGSLTLTSFGPASGGAYPTTTTTTSTYAGIETFNGNGYTISGVNNGSDIMDFSGFATVQNLGTINTLDATGGTDYVNVSTSTAGVTVNGGGGKQIVIGSNFGDTIDGKSDNDTISAGGGDDTITGGSGADNMDGGIGNDTFNVSGSDAGNWGDTFTGGSDNDTIKNTATSALLLTSFGPSGSSTSSTYSSIETLDGNNQVIDANNAVNTLDFSLIGLMKNVTAVTLQDGNDTVTTSTNHTVVTTYDGQGGSGDTINLVFTTTQLGAFSVADIVTLNTYVAAPTGKTLAPSGGTQNIASLQFSARNFETATANVLVDGQLYNITSCLVGIGNVVTMTTANYTDPAGKNSLIVGTAAANNINAGDLHDMVFGGAGNDSITGGDGNDCLFGGEDNDTFFASFNQAEFDVLQGGNGIDTLQRTNAINQNNLVLNGFSSTNGIEKINLDWAGQNKAIEGNGNGNILDFSVLTYLSGNVYGVDGNDTITATNSDARSYYGGNGDDILNGGTQNDTLIGGIGIDSISGNEGNDRIVGDLGADTLTGGNGTDVFRFTNPSEGIDTITDFVVVDDTIEISVSGFPGVGGPGTLSAARFAYLGSETALSRIVYNSGTGALFYDANGSGIGAAVQFAQLSVSGSGIPPLTYSDFSIGF